MISTANEHKLYNGNGSATVFPYDFKIFEDANLEVIVADANDAQTTLTLNTHYTVSGAGEDTGGNVTTLDLTAICGSVKLPTGWVISIRRVLALLQETDFNNQSAFYPETHETQFDKLVSMIQQQQNEIDRCPKVTSTSGDTGDVFFETIENMIADGQADINVTLGQAEVARDAAIAAQGLAETAQAAAELAETNAETAETNAETAEANAAQSAIDAAASVAAAGLPASVAGHGGEVLRVKGDETGYEFDSNITPQIQTGDSEKIVAVKSDETGYELVVKKAVVKTYTNINQLGVAGQLEAGHIFELDEMGVGTDRALFLFASSGALLTDEKATYNLTNTGTVVVCDGTGTKKNIFGSAKGAYFDGGANSYLTQATLWDTIANGIFKSFYLWADDGQPAAQQDILSIYNDANNYLTLSLLTSGVLQWGGKVNGNTVMCQNIETIPNGAMAKPILIQITKDATYGLRLFVNRRLKGISSTANAKAALAVTTSTLYIGANNAGANRFTGVIDMLRCQNRTPSYLDLETESATIYDIPSSLQSQDFKTFGFVKDSSNIEREVSTQDMFLKKTSTKLYAYPFLNGLQSTDQIKIYGGLA